MNFREALEITKSNPGSLLTRDNYGEFVVQLSDGSVLTDTETQDADPKDTIHHLRVENDRLLTERRELQIDLESEEEKNINLKAEVARLTSIISSLKDKISDVPDRIWKEIEKQKEEIAEERKKEERARLLKLVESNTLWYEQIQVILDRATQLGFSREERKIIAAAHKKSRHKPVQ